MLPHSGSNDAREECAESGMEFQECPGLSEQLSAFQWDSVELLGWLVQPAS